jgi:hypothetical protein
MPPSLDRTQCRFFRSGEPSDDDYGYMEGSPADRLSLVWELTREVWSLVPGQDPEAPMRRDLVRLIRPDGQDSSPNADPPVSGVTGTDDLDP